MLKAYKYRLYPTKKQVQFLTTQLDGHRFLYNKALEQRKEVYEKTKEGIGCFTQIKTLLPKLKKENRQMSLCNCNSLQQTLRRLDKSFKAFFRRAKAGKKPGYPRFKCARRFNTISYGAIGDGCQIKENRLYLQNAGLVKVKWHRPIEGTVKTLYITRRNYKWHVSFFVECEPELLPKTNREIGIDMGLDSFVATSDGQKIDTPKYFRQSERMLATAQRRLCRRKKGSSRRNKARVLLSRVHEKIANRRLDFCHKLAHKLVQCYDGFAVEKLNIKNMVKNRYLAKSISDASWGIFLGILKSKAENAGRQYKEVNPRGTSQMCSNCGADVPKSLAIKIHNCPLCGLSLDRDINAARNILSLARTGPSGRENIGSPCELRS